MPAAYFSAMAACGRSLLSHSWTSASQAASRQLSMAAARGGSPSPSKGPDIISIAPMMEVTDVFYRYVQTGLVQLTYGQGCMHAGTSCGF